MKKIDIDCNSINFIKFYTSDQFYDSWDVFLRELLQNAYDACLLRQALEWSWGTEFLELEAAEQVKDIRKSFDPRIVLSFDSSTGMLYVEDNGIGINESDLLKYVAHLGESYYTSPAFAEQRLDYQPISQFGIGLCSCFRVSRAILIESKKDKVINTAWNVMDRQDLTPIAAKWMQGKDQMEYVTDTQRHLTGTRISLALLPQYAVKITARSLVHSIRHYMACQPIPIDIYYDKQKLTLDQPRIAPHKTTGVVGIVTLQIDNEEMEGYLSLYNEKHAYLFGKSQLYQQNFRIIDDADSLGIKPEWIRYMNLCLNLKKRSLNLKVTRDGVARDVNLKKLRMEIGMLIAAYYKENPIALSQYLVDGTRNVLTEYDGEMELVEKAQSVSIYRRGKEVELPMHKIIDGLMGQSARFALISKDLLQYFHQQYPLEYKEFVGQYDLLLFEKNRELFCQFLAPYMTGQHYVISNLPGIIYIEMNLEFVRRKRLAPYKDQLSIYPEERLEQVMFCYVCNEVKGPFQIFLNKESRNAKIFAAHEDNPRVNNLREVILENIKQRIRNPHRNWDKIIDFGGSFVEEWTGNLPITAQSVWCLEEHFPEEVNDFIHHKFSPSERLEMGIEGLVFHKDDFISWWYAPKG